MITDYQRVTIRRGFEHHSLAELKASQAFHKDAHDEMPLELTAVKLEILAAMIKEKGVGL